MSEADVLSTKDFDLIKSTLYNAAGIRLADHKRQMVQNRINKRLKQLSLDSIHGYVNVLKKNEADELLHLVNALTTNVTHFFREGHHFDHIAQTIPALNEEPGGKIKAWCAGCSIGAEPYSLAITAHKTAKKIKKSVNMRILATDIDTIALARARKGEFNERIIKGLSEAELKESFSERQEDQEKFFTVKDHIRKLVAYNYLNLNEKKWPMSGPFDYIFCRNVLIYFDRDKQNEYVSKMVNLLRSGGFLYLGHSEHAIMEGRGLKICGQTIYQKVT